MWSRPSNVWNVLFSKWIFDNMTWDISGLDVHGIFWIQTRDLRKSGFGFVTNPKKLLKGGLRFVTSPKNWLKGGLEFATSPPCCQFHLLSSVALSQTGSVIMESLCCRKLEQPRILSLSISKYSNRWATMDQHAQISPLSGFLHRKSQGRESCQVLFFLTRPNHHPSSWTKIRIDLVKETLCYLSFLHKQWRDLWFCSIQRPDSQPERIIWPEIFDRFMLKVFTSMKIVVEGRVSHKKLFFVARFPQSWYDFDLKDE